MAVLALRLYRQPWLGSRGGFDHKGTKGTKDTKKTVLKLAAIDGYLYDLLRDLGDFVVLPS